MEYNMTHKPSYEDLEQSLQKSKTSSATNFQTYTENLRKKNATINDLNATINDLNKKNKAIELQTLQLQRITEKVVEQKKELARTKKELTETKKEVEQLKEYKKQVEDIYPKLQIIKEDIAENTKKLKENEQNIQNMQAELAKLKAKTHADISHTLPQRESAQETSSKKSELIELTLEIATLEKQLLLAKQNTIEQSQQNSQQQHEIKSHHQQTLINKLAELSKKSTSLSESLKNASKMNVLYVSIMQKELTSKTREIREIIKVLSSNDSTLTTQCQSLHDCDPSQAHTESTDTYTSTYPSTNDHHTQSFSDSTLDSLDLNSLDLNSLDLDGLDLDDLHHSDQGYHSRSPECSLQMYNIQHTKQSPGPPTPGY